MMKAVLGRHLGSQPPAGACPDAEMLAVYAERRVAAEERMILESHIATCLRCQAHVAALVRSEPPATEASLFASWFAGTWRWLVPAASAALVLLAVWVARSPMTTPMQKPVAQQTQPSVAAETPAASPAEPTAAPRANEVLAERTAKEATAPSASDARRGVEAFRSAQAPPPAERDQVQPVPAKPEDLRSDAARNRDQERQSDRAAGEPPARPAALAGERREGVEESKVLGSSAPAWRLAGGAVERSIDGGVSWTSRFRPADSTLRAVSGPSLTVCWAVGNEGAVHRTRDGETWTRVAFPERVPLVAVHAIDGERAVVTAADGRRFETADGGLTWRSIG
jgi:hypothetical protein